MITAFSVHGWKEYQEWQQIDRRRRKKLDDLIEEVKRTPYSGTGQPEKLRGNLAGYWSRRIDQEHRITYKLVQFAKAPALLIAQCLGHY